VWGTRGPNTFDCSGLAQAAYRQIGLEIGWNTADQFLNSRNRERNHLVAGSQGIRTMVTLRQILQPGDLIYIGVDNSGGDGVSDHVVMYVGENTAYPVGDRRRYEIVHASSPSRGVVKDPLYLPAIVSGVLRPAAGLPPAG
jgi:cell wall-associated NlpC family hydrolase